MKKFFIITGAVILFIFLSLLVLPIVFKGKIVNLIKTEANKQLTATLDFKDVNLSFIRNFPNVSLHISDLSIANRGVFEGDTLIRAQKIGLTLNIMSVIKGDEISIKSVLLENARLNVKVLADGTANYDITKPSEPVVGEPPVEEPSAFKIALQRYTFNNIDLIYNDKSLGLKTTIKELYHEGKGDFTADMTNLTTRTKIASLDLTYDGIKYLSKLKVDYKAAFALNLKESIYEFKENELLLNELPLNFQGKIAMPADDIDVDLKFNALKSEFKNFLSIIPGTFTDDFKDLKSAGTLAFDGFVKGIYNDKSIPAFNLNLKVENGMFQYPSLPEAVKNVQIACNIAGPGVDVDRTVVDISKFSLLLGTFPFDATLLLKTPVSDPDIDSKIKTTLDLNQIKNFYPLESGTTLAGLLKADMQFKGKMSAIEQQKFEQFQAAGDLVLTNFNYNDKELVEPIAIANAAFNFNPRFAELTALNMTLGKSDLALKGRFENYLAYVFKDGLIKGNLDLNSRFFDINPYLADEDPKPEATTTAPANESAAYFQLPDNIDFTFNANMGKVLYDNMEISNLKGGISLKERVLRMNKVSLETLGGSMTADGFYDTRKTDGAQIDFNLGIRDLLIKETAKTFNTVRQLAPIAENTVGKVSGNLGFNMTTDLELNPVYPTLNGKGNLQTSMIVIEGFEMVKKIAETLKIDKLKKWQMEKLNIGFEIKQGRIFVDPFDTKIANYKAKIGGSNGFDQSIDYVLDIDIPRAEFGGQANAVLNNLVAQANTKGLSASVGEIIPVELRIGGTFTNPTVKTDINDRAKDAFKDLKAEAEQKLREEAERLRKELEDKARNEADKLKKDAENRVNQEVDKAKEEAERIKAEAERKAKEEADKAKKEAERKAKEEAEKKAKGLFKR